jgi:hypothetical protein
VSRLDGRRWLLAAYPRDYREQYGPEILATLAQSTRPGRIPPMREIIGLVRGGMATRPRHTAEGPVPWWADGIHLGIFVLALTAFAPGAANLYDAVAGEAQHPGFLFSPWWYPWSDLLPLLIALALMRGRAWIALPPAVAMAFGQIRFLVASPARHQGIDLFPAIPLFDQPASTPRQALPSLLILAGLMVLVARRRPMLRHRSWCWWLPVLIAGCAQEIWTEPPHYLAWPGPQAQWAILPAYLTVVLLVLALWATAISGDLRWTLAFGITVTAQELATVNGLPATLREHDTTTILYSGGAALLMAVMVLTTRRAHRRA